MHPIQRAISHFGSQAAMAARLEVSQPTISEWLRGDRRVPAERCPQIERATEGAVRCEELRPDVAWDVLRMQAAPELATAKQVA
jgi:DNA-binding transcriptional regulator YdaS (Cro superfamily)